MIRAILAIALLAASPATAATCDSGCLKRLASSFVDSLMKRDWGKGVPWADRVRYSENGVGMAVGDGIWATVTRHTDKPLLVADPDTASVIWIGMIEEHGQPGYLALRLKADGNRIAEAEAIMRRKEGRPPYADAAAFVPDKAFGETVPASARSPRERMIGLAQGYLNSLGANDGTVLTRLSPDCVRTENGQLMMSGDAAPARLATGCEGQIKAGLFRDIDRIRGVKFPVVDEERGIIVAIGMRDYSGRARTLTTTDGRAFAPDAPFPHSYAFVIAFKVQGGAITRIAEISAHEVPYLMPAWRDE